MKKIFFILSIMFVWVSVNHVSAQVSENIETRAGTSLTVVCCNSLESPQTISCEVIDSFTGVYLYNKTFYDIPARMCTADFFSPVVLKANKSYRIRAYVGGVRVEESVNLKMGNGLSMIKIEQDMTTGIPKIVLM